MFKYWENAVAGAKAKVDKLQRLKDAAPESERIRQHLELMKAKNEQFYFETKLELEQQLASLS